MDGTEPCRVRQRAGALMFGEGVEARWVLVRRAGGVVVGYFARRFLGPERSDRGLVQRRVRPITSTAGGRKFRRARS